MSTKTDLIDDLKEQFNILSRRLGGSDVKFQTAQFYNIPTIDVEDIFQLIYDTNTYLDRLSLDALAEENRLLRQKLSDARKFIAGFDSFVPR